MIKNNDIPSFDSISDMVRHHGGDISAGDKGDEFSGERVKLKEVSIGLSGTLSFLIDDKGNRIPLFGKGIESGYPGMVDVIGTYHGDFFRVYEVEQHT